MLSHESSGQRPLAFEWRLGTLDQQHLQQSVPDGEYRQIDRDRKGRELSWVIPGRVAGDSRSAVTVRGRHLAFPGDRTAVLPSWCEPESGTGKRLASLEHLIDSFLG